MSRVNWNEFWNLCERITVVSIQIVCEIHFENDLKPSPKIVQKESQLSASTAEGIPSLFVSNAMNEEASPCNAFERGTSVFSWAVG